MADREISGFPQERLEAAAALASDTTAGWLHDNMREGEVLERVIILIETNEGSGFTSHNPRLGDKSKLDQETLRDEVSEAMASMIYTLAILAKANGKVFAIVTEEGIIDL